MRHISSALLALGLVVTSSLQAAGLIPAQSRIDFHGTQMGQRFDGQITRFEAVARFDDARQLQQFSLSIPATALVTGNAQRDRTLQTAAWLDSARYPILRFEGTPRHWQENGFEIDGTLSIRDQQHPLTLQVQQLLQHGTITLETTGKIDRMRYQLGTSGDWLNTHTVGQTIEFEAQLKFVSAP